MFVFWSFTTTCLGVLSFKFLCLGFIWLPKSKNPAIVSLNFAFPPLYLSNNSLLFEFDFIGFLLGYFHSWMTFFVPVSWFFLSLCHLVILKMVSCISPSVSQRILCACLQSSFLQRAFTFASSAWHYQSKHTLSYIFRLQLFHAIWAVLILAPKSYEHRSLLFLHQKIFYFSTSLTIH